MKVKVFASRKLAGYAGFTKVGLVGIRGAKIPKSRRIAIIRYIQRISEKHSESKEEIGLTFNPQSVAICVSPNANPKMLTYFMDKMHYALQLDVQNGKVIKK